MSAPVDGKESRWEVKGEETRLPPWPLTGYILNWLFELSPTRSSGFGVVGVNWDEVESWAKLTGRLLEPNEARALFHLSHAYAGMFNAAMEKDCQPAFVADIETQRKTVSDSLETMLMGMAKGPAK